MDLYYSPFACSLAAHVVCLEAEVDVTLRRIDINTKHVEGGGDLSSLNPMGQVPTLVCDDGRVLTESAAVLLYLGSRAPARGLVPAVRSTEYYDELKWLSFVATELHKKVNSPIFLEGVPKEVKNHARANATGTLSALEHHLEERPTLVGDGFTVVDAYLFWALTILPFGGVPLDAYPALRAYHARHLERPAIRRALKFDREKQATPMTA